jgi:adenylate cyclase class 2
MERSTHEIEVKLAFDAPAAARDAIERLGARIERPRHFEDNFVFDRATDPLLAAGILLRLRRVDAEATLTVKLPVAGDHRHKVRDEHETAVADPAAMREILHGLGFSVRYRYQKQRTVFRLGRLALCLDETPIGCFVELEGPPAEIDRAARDLGFGPERYVRETYRDLHERVARERGVAVGDLLFDAAGADAP